MGRRYRATVSGPGVLPDVAWQAAAPASYDRAFDRASDERQLVLLADDALCRPR
jgi:hypothetical protein